MDTTYGLKLRQNLIHNNGARNFPDPDLSYIYDFEIYNNKVYSNKNYMLLSNVGIQDKDQSFFYNNIIHAQGSGGKSGYNYLRSLKVYRAKNAVFSGNIIRNSSRYGVCFDSQLGPIDFRHNKVCDNARAGVLINGTFSGNMFKNLIVGNTWSGIRIRSNASGDLKIYNNTIADNGRAGIEFEGGLTTSTYSLSHNILAFNTLAGYRYGDETWPSKDRWDWVDKDKNFFFWNYGSLAGGPYNHEATQFLNAQWGGPGGTGTDDITMEEAHRNYDQNAWDFLSDPDDPYSLDSWDATGVLEVADGESAGAYSQYVGSSATYTTEDPPDLTPPDEPYVEGSTVDPPAVPPVADVPSPFSG
jgi:hypothetical protein